MFLVSVRDKSIVIFMKNKIHYLCYFISPNLEKVGSIVSEAINLSFKFIKNIVSHGGAAE